MEEILDIFKEDGSWCGTAPRSEVHEKGYWHKTAQVWLLNEEDELLLQLRSDKKDCFPGVWDISTAGHVPAGTEILLSAVRELEEELGVRCNEKDLEHLFTLSEPYIDYISGRPDNEISFVYLLNVRKDIQLTLQKEEVSAVRWLHFDKLLVEFNENRQNFVPHDTHFAKLVDVLRNR